MHLLEWFEKRIGKTLIRTRKDIPTGRIIASYVELKNDTIQYHYQLQQEKGYEYDDNKPKLYGTGTGKARLGG